MNKIKPKWRIPIALLLLSAVPVLAGLVRLIVLAMDHQTPDNARFFASPTPVILHVIAITFFCLVGAFQFAPPIRRQFPKMHRAVAKPLFLSAMVSALSGLWMTLFYALPAHDGVLLNATRIAVGVAMLCCLFFGLTAIRKRDFQAHRAWMMRTYGLGMGAGTQVLTTLPYVLFFGDPSTWARAILMGFAWLINIFIVEWILARNNTT